MRNKEHYPDCTAGCAVRTAMKNDPRVKTTYTKVFDGNGNKRAEGVRYTMPNHISVSQMNLEELGMYLRACGQCNGNPTICRDSCRGKCAWGTRAVELLQEAEKEKSGDDGDVVQVHKMSVGRARQCRAIYEYQKALMSGDPIAFVAQSIKSCANEQQRIYMATAKLKRWERDYGGLVRHDGFSLLDGKKPERKPVHENQQGERCFPKCDKGAERLADAVKALDLEIEGINTQIAALTRRRDRLSDARDLLIEKS